MSPRPSSTRNVIYRRHVITRAYQRRTEQPARGAMFTRKPSHSRDSRLFLHESHNISCKEVARSRSVFHLREDVHTWHTNTFSNSPHIRWFKNAFCSQTDSPGMLTKCDEPRLMIKLYQGDLETSMILPARG